MGALMSCNIGLVVQTRTPPGSLLQISKKPLIKFLIFGILRASLAIMFLTKNLKYSTFLHSRKRDYYSCLGTSLSVEGSRRIRREICHVPMIYLI
jgi:hypothetical protein